MYNLEVEAVDRLDGGAHVAKGAGEWCDRGAGEEQRSATEDERMQEVSKKRPIISARERGQCAFRCVRACVQLCEVPVVPQIAVREWESVSRCRTFRKVQTAAHGIHQERRCLNRWVRCIISLHALIPPHFVVQAPALAATLCPLLSDTSTTTTPSPAAPLTPSTVAWAAPVRTKPEALPKGLLCPLGSLPSSFLNVSKAHFYFGSGLRGLQPRTEVPFWWQGHSLWPDGNSVLFDSEQRKAHMQRLERREFDLGSCVRK